MKAGRDLDALVADQVMGRWTVDDGDWPLGGYYTTKHGKRGRYAPPYSQDISAAWEVVEKCRERRLDGSEQQHVIWSMELAPNGDVWCVAFLEGDVSWRTATAPTAPHAICLAALAALGVIAEYTYPALPVRGSDQERGNGDTRRA